jgi:hypothetical protein
MTVLKSLAGSISWDVFRPLLDKGYEHKRKSNEGGGGRGLIC